MYNNRVVCGGMLVTVYTRFLVLTNQSYSNKYLKKEVVYQTPVPIFSITKLIKLPKSKPTFILKFIIMELFSF